jgi:hypothetical protein
VPMIGFAHGLGVLSISNFGSSAFTAMPKRVTIRSFFRLHRSRAKPSSTSFGSVLTGAHPWESVT